MPVTRELLSDACVTIIVKSPFPDKSSGPRVSVQGASA